MISKIGFLLIAGLVIRIIIGAFTFHQDYRTFSFTSAIFFKEGSLDFYDFNRKLSEDDSRKEEYRVEELDDLPLQYLITLPFYLPLRSFVDQNFEVKFHTNAEKEVSNPAIFLYSLYVKLPFIFFDLALGLLLMKFFKHEREKLLVFTGWMFYPITLWATSAIGQVDIIPTFFLVLAFLFYKQHKNMIASFSLGVSIALKSFPVLFLPIIFFYLTGWRERLTGLILILVPLALTVLPYLPSHNFRQNALLAPQLSKMLYANVSISGGENILIVPTILIVIYLFFLKQKRSANELGRYFLAILLITLSFTHFHLQWFLWLSPFLFIFYKIFFQRNIYATSGLFIAWVGMLFLFQGSLQVQLFSPALPDLMSQKGLAEALPIAEVNYLRTLTATLFAGCSLYLSYYLISPGINKSND